MAGRNRIETFKRDNAIVDIIKNHVGVKNAISGERVHLLNDLQKIRANPDFEMLPISSSKGVKIANEEEFDRYIKLQYKSASRKLAKVYAMAKKGNRHNQIDLGGHTVESFLENLPETP